MHAGAHTQRASRLCVCVCVRVRHSMRAPRHACVQARLHAHTRTRMQARARTQPNTRLLAHFRLVCQGVAIHDPRVAGDFDCDRSFLVRGRERAVAQVPFEVCLHRDCTDGAESEYQLGRCRQTPAGLRAACARTRGKIPGLAKSAAAAPNPTTAWLILTDRPPSPSPERICSFPAPLRSTGRARLGGAAATARASPKPSWRKGTSSLVIATARARARAFARGWHTIALLAVTQFRDDLGRHLRTPAALPPTRAARSPLCAWWWPPRPAVRARSPRRSGSSWPRAGAEHGGWRCSCTSWLPQRAAVPGPGPLPTSCWSLGWGPPTRRWACARAR